MAEDRELTEWLATNILDWTLWDGGHGFSWWLKRGAPYKPQNVLCGISEFTPLESLDDARLLEDRLRELDLHRKYITILDQEILYPKYGPQKVPAERIKYATAREICEAVRRTWLQRKESEGTK